MSEMIERVLAPAIYEEFCRGQPWEEATEGWQKSMRESARAAVSALEKAGYAIVPREPTEAMLKAGRDVAPHWHDDPMTPPIEYWQAMIAAAPTD